MLRIRSFSRDLLISVCSLLLFSGIARGQILNVTDDTSTPTHGAGHDYIKMVNETVNPANGSVSLRIQVPMPKGRGLTLPFAFAYDSSGVWHLEARDPGYAAWAGSNDYVSLGGWTYTVPRLNMAEVKYMVTYLGRQTPCYVDNDYVFNDAGGGRHSFRMDIALTAGQACRGYVSHLQGSDPQFQATLTAPPSETATLTDNDGTFYQFTSPGTNYASDDAGEYYSALPAYVQDRNGNQITITDDGNGAFSYQDTAGRTVLSSSGFGATGNTVTVSSVSGNYSLTWQPFSLNPPQPGSTQIGNDSYCFAPGQGSAGGQNQPRITSITLPNQTSYTFDYDSTFGLTQHIYYPSGGYIRYAWGWNPRAEYAVYPDSNGSSSGCQYTYDTPALLHRYVSFDGVNEVLEQDFSYTTNWNYPDWSSKTTTVTTTVKTVSNGALQTIGSYTTAYTYGFVYAVQNYYQYSQFGRDIPVEASIVYGDYSGSTLETVTKAWYNLYQLSDETVALAGGNTPTKKTHYNYNSYACAASISEKDEYDYGPGAPGALLRKTLYTYGDPFTGTGICDRPTSVTTQDGSGDQIAQTNYTYDGTTPTATSGITGHVALPSGTPRGNATTVSAWLNTTGGYLSTTYTYEDTGQVLSKTDPLQNTTYYSYTDSFTSGSPPGPTHAYLTQITYPPTVNAQHVESFSYSYADGQLTVSTDENQQSTQFAYADALDRLTSITYPDGGQTTYGYWNVCGHPSQTAISPNYTETASLDGICNVTQTAITSDPQGNDYTNTTYTGLGQVRTVSNPYRTTSDTSYGLTTTSYDGIGRTVQVTYSDGSAATTSFSANSYTVTDPAGVQRTVVSDALARLTSVTENPSGLNYSTSYTYDALNDLLTVNQGGQTRTFTYDSLKRLLSASNPESGTTSYSYDADSNMLTRQDARGIVTTYAYDALNRTTSKTYTDGTPTAHFAYDEASVTLGSWTSPTLAYPIGRLTHTTTVSGSALQTATVEDYDKMGRPQHYWQCTPLNCGSASIWAALYNYDVAGNVTSWNHPGGFTLTNTISNAHRITQVTSSLNDSTHPATLAQNILYNAAGDVTSLQNGCVGSGCTIIQETYFYNQRMQMAVAELGNSTTHGADSCRVYNYYVGATNVSACSELPSAWPTGNNNNGDVAGYYYVDNISTGLNHSAVYTYDAVNRLKSAAATGNSTYSQTFSFDAYGNMTCAASPQEPKCLGPTYYAASNHIVGYTYDAAGNVINDGTYTYAWDAEAHLTKVINGKGTAISTNTYNALGQRVRDVTTSATTDEAYGAGGNLLWRYTGDPSNMRSFVPFRGAILAEYYPGTGTMNPLEVGSMTTTTSGTLFDHPDELGSITTGTSYDGSPCQERLFYPFGELWTGAGSCGMHQTFAQLPDYDSETDQYNTPNRHYNPTGRWLSPDPGGLKVVQLADPQTWNMYAYARNNPTTVTDPSGLITPELNGDRWSDDKLVGGCMDTGPCGDDPAVITDAATTNEENATKEAEKQPQIVVFSDNPNPSVVQPTRGGDADRTVMYHAGETDERGKMHLDNSATLTLHEEMDPNSKNPNQRIANPPQSEKGGFEDYQYVRGGEQYRVLRDWKVNGEPAMVYDKATKQTYRYEVTTFDASAKVAIKTEYRNTRPW
jgi:RHS repeat-associated protein